MISCHNLQQIFKKKKRERNKLAHAADQRKFRYFPEISRIFSKTVEMQEQRGNNADFLYSV